MSGYKGEMMNRLIKIFLAAAFMALGMTAVAYDRSYYADRSKLASGRWVKVAVSTSGIHQISYDRLREAGFASPEKVVVYGYGGARLTSNEFSQDLPDDLPPAPSVHTADGRLLFYGEADLNLSVRSRSDIDIARNLYDRRGYYFLTEGTPVTPPALLGTKPQNAADHHLSAVYEENDLYNPADGGATFHDRELSPGDAQTFRFTINDFDPYGNRTEGQLYFMYAARNSNGPTEIIMTVPEGIALKPEFLNPAAQISQNNKIFSSGLGQYMIEDVDADGEYSFTFAIEPDKTPQYAAMDYVYLIYPRRNNMDGVADRQLIMSLPDVSAGTYVRVDRSNSNVRIWDITDPARVSECQTYYDSDGKSTYALCDGGSNASRTTKMIAFDAGVEFPQAEICPGEVSQDLHGCSVPQMVIITTDELRAAADELARIHKQTDGLDVMVVTQREIFNEFSSGTRSAMAYRRFAKMLYDRDPVRFRHILIYGHGTWDNRSEEKSEKVICYEAEDVNYARDRTTNYTSDKYFAMLGDRFVQRVHFNQMSVTVGRLPVINEADGRAINAKIENFLSSERRSDIYASILLISDDGDSMNHFKQAEEADTIFRNDNKAMTVTKVHNAIYPLTDKIAAAGRKRISSALTAGTGMMCYVGHCSHIAFTGERIYDIDLINRTEYETYPFAHLATCETFGFDRNDNLVGTAMLRKAKGGAIALIGSSRAVYMDYNQMLTKAVAKAYAEATPETTIGDIQMKAHNECVALHDQNPMVNTMCYNLCGDPSLKVGAPHRGITIESIGAHTPAGEEFTVDALQEVEIKGYVHSSDDAIPDKEYDGVVEIVIYDTPYAVPNRESPKLTARLDDRRLVSVTGKVTAGRFTVKALAPAPSAGEGNNRLAVFAYDAAKMLSAAGGYDGMKLIDSMSDDEPVDEAPVIDELYLDDQTFVEGTTVGQNATAFATIRSGSVGLYTADNGIGCAPKLVLDGCVVIENTAAGTKLGDDGIYRLKIPVRNMSQGRHRLTLTVRSNLGSITSRTISFMVNENTIEASIVLPERTVRSEACFDLINNSDEEAATRLLIENAAGRTVFVADNCPSHFVWNLRNMSGTEVPDGLYRAYIQIMGRENYGSSEKIEFVVVR